MSEATTPTRRIGTRAVVRQENSAMAETESPPTEAASSQTVTTLESPKVEVKVVPKEEPQPEPVETPAVPVTTATTLTLITTPLPVTTSLTSSPTTNTVNTTAAAVQMKDSSFLLQPLGFTHRKRKANFSNEETETLVKYVVKHFSALYGSEALRTESTRRNQRRSQLWNQIQKHVNELGYTPRSIDDLKHKWRDLRLEVKRKITHRKTANKTPSTAAAAAAAAATTATATPIIDTKLNPLEEQVASTIGHHCSLDGEQEGLYIEPGVPRQSIFFNCRGSPGAPMPDLGMDKLGTGSPRPTVDLSLMSSLVSTSPAQLSFVLDGDNEDMDVTPSVARTAAPTVAPVVAPAVTIKPFPDTWTAVKDLGALVTTPNILSAPQTILTALPQIFTVKQEVVTTQPLLAPARCESQSSMVSSPEGSVSNVTTPAEWNGDSAAASLGSIEMVKLKEEDEDGDSQGTGKKSPLPESQDEWEGQSASPQPSDNGPEDSLPSTSSQDGDPPSGTDLPTNDNCSCDTGGKDEVKAKMQRLLELEERWDRMYDQELGIWEEERTRQQQQRNQDRELQQQLLGVLTDIRDELRQLREERAAARQNQTAANGPPAAPTVEKSPKKAAVTPKAAANQRTPPSGKRRGRPPRINKPVPEPTRPIRPAPGHSSKS